MVFSTSRESLLSEGTQVCRSSGVSICTAVLVQQVNWRELVEREHAGLVPKLRQNLYLCTEASKLSKG